MAQDHHSPSNQLEAPEASLALAVEDYQSQQQLCAFHTNRGHCHKGEYCTDLHLRLRHGAVTADREEQLVAVVGEHGPSSPQPSPPCSST